MLDVDWLILVGLLHVLVVSCLFLLLLLDFSASGSFSVSESLGDLPALQYRNHTSKCVQLNTVVNEFPLKFMDVH